jgi:tetratricopeptide (TPR) repeat protein
MINKSHCDVLKMPRYNLDLDYVVPVIDITKEQLNEIIAEADKIISANGKNPKEQALAYLKKAQCLQKIEECTSVENSKAEIGDDQDIRIETQNYIKKIVEKALELNPNMSEALMQTGKIYYKLSEFDNANLDKTINMYTQAIQLKPDYATAFNNRGIVYASQIFSSVKDNNYQENLMNAITDFDKAIRLKPFEAIYYLNRRRQYSKLKEHGKAIADFSESLRLRPDLNKVLLLRGLEYSSSGEKDKAKADFDKYLRLKCG